MLLFVALVTIVSGASPEPRLQPPDAGVTAGAAAAFTLRPQPGGPMWIDGCAAVELERREGDGWLSVPSTVPCDGSAPARSVTKDLVLTLAFLAPGTYRGAVAWGSGCVDGRPFSMAACKARGVVRSAEFVVALPAAPSQR